MNYIKPYFPILTWAPKYNVKEYAVRDLIAGITVALTVVPQVCINNLYTNFGENPPIGFYMKIMRYNIIF